MTEARRPGRPDGLRRRLAGEDEELWRRVAASVEPLRRRTAPATPREDAAPPETEEAGPRRTRPPARPQPQAAPADRARGGDLTGIDRRTRQKLTRGRVEIDARIDLHGSTRLAARGRLLAFLAEARARGHRNVLVITGKGQAPFARHTLHGADHFHTPERRGVLRQAVSEWLGEPDFTAHVSGFQPAHPKHGGGGAYYVRLRRVRAPR